MNCSIFYLNKKIALKSKNVLHRFRIIKFDDFIFNYIRKCSLFYLRHESKKVLKIMQKNQNHPPVENMTLNQPIWVFWWQGVENAPKLIKLCIDSIKKNSCGHEVILLDKKNISKYTNIPDYIFKKLERNIISITHFSDILRSCLLYTWGGVWIDATLFVTKPIDNIFFASKINPGIKVIPSEQYRYITDGKWTAFFLGSSERNGKLFSYLYNFFLYYWKHNNKQIEYFLIDYIIFIAYTLFPDIKNEIDGFPLNNQNWDKLSVALKNNNTQEVNSLLADSSTTIFKLSWKDNYKNLEQQLT